MIRLANRFVAISKSRTLFGGVKLTNTEWHHRSSMSTVSDKEKKERLEKVKKEMQKSGQSDFLKMMEKSDEEQRKAGEQQSPNWQVDLQRVIAFGLMAAATILGAAYFNGGFNFFKDRQVQMPEKYSKKLRSIPKIPATSEEIPKEVPYLLIGGGTASFSAFRAIKSSDPLAKILIISDDEHLPYMRPPLSKEMWFNQDKNVAKTLRFKQWNGNDRSLLYEPEEFYTPCSELSASTKGGVSVARGWKITNLDVVNRTATLHDGTVIKFEKCLLATGALPKSLPVFEKDPQLHDKVTLFRSIHDYETVREALQSATSVVVVGNGFLGSELACALATNSAETVTIHQIFPESGNLTKILPEYLSAWCTEKIRSEGVNVVTNTKVTHAQSIEHGVRLQLSNGQQIDTSHVIVSVGVEPDTQLARTAGLETDANLGGFLVNAELEARKNIFAAGDCACFYDVQLGRRRVSHHDHAVVSGRVAGGNMAGASNPYTHQSMFWSDLGPDIGFEAIGIIDSTLPTVGVFLKTDQSTSDPSDNNNDASTRDVEAVKADSQSGSPTTNIPRDDYSKGVLFYLRDSKIVGIIMWNVFNRMAVARAVLKADQVYDDLSEVAKLFRLHEE